MINIKNVFFQILIFTANLRINIVFELLDHIRITFEKIKKNIFSIQINEIYVVSNSEFHRKLKIKTSVSMCIATASSSYIESSIYGYQECMHRERHTKLSYTTLYQRYMQSRQYIDTEREKREREITIYSDFFRSIVYIDSEV